MIDEFVLIIIAQTVLIIIILAAMVIREARRSKAYDELLVKTGKLKGEYEVKIKALQAVNKKDDDNNISN